MFNLFKKTLKIDAVEPVLPKQPTPFKKKPSLKADALKTIEKVLNDLQNVNNPKVDSLRKLFNSIENGNDLESVVAYYKQPIGKKKKEKKFVSGKFF